MRLCGVSGILFSRRGEQIILLFFIQNKKTASLQSGSLLMVVRLIYSFMKCLQFNSKMRIAFYGHSWYDYHKDEIPI